MHTPQPLFTFSLLCVLFFVAGLFAFLPFAGKDRFFSLPVSSAWLGSSAARRLRWGYQGAVLLLTIATAVAVWVLVPAHPLLASLAPVLYIILLSAAFASGWRHTLPASVPQPVTRSAQLGRGGLSGMAATLAALAPLAAVGCVLLARYSSLTIAVPQRTPVAIFAVPLLGAVAVLAIAALLHAVQARAAGVADDGRYFSRLARVTAASAWFVAMGSAVLALAPLMHSPSAYAAHVRLVVALAAPAFLGAVLFLLFRSSPQMASVQNATDPAHWRGGLFYFNRGDSALFVPKRLGLGWSLNFAHPAAWLVLAVILGLAFAPLAFRSR